MGRDYTTSSSRSNRAGDSQSKRPQCISVQLSGLFSNIPADNPIMLEEDSTIVAESGLSKRPLVLGQRLDPRTVSAPTRRKGQRPSNTWKSSPLLSLQTNLLIGWPLPSGYYPSIYAGKSFVETIMEHRWSQALPGLSLHRLLSNPKPELQPSNRMNGRSERWLARNGWEKAMNTRYVGRIHGCLRASWETHKTCCGTSKSKVERSVDGNRVNEPL